MNFEKQESTGQSQLSVGVLEAKVIMINSTRKQLCEWRGWEQKPDDKEIEYVGEDKDNNTRVTIDFCLEDVATGKKFQKSFRVSDKKSTSEKSGKAQYCNQLGMSTWVDDKANLPKWFTNLQDKEKNPIAELDWRTALQGEADVYEFMRNWLSGKDSNNQSINWYAPSTNILLDTKKLLRGNVDELRSLLQAPPEENITGTVVCIASVYITEKDGEKKMYQNIANVFMPGYRMKQARLAASTNSWNADKNTKRFMEQCTGDYGIKDAYSLDILKDFVESEHLQATNTTIQHSDSAAPETLDY